VIPALDHVQRIEVKLYLRDGAAVEPRALLPVFHGWIRDRRLGDEVLVDVVDYGHMHRGPGVLLIGHAADWALDDLDGRRGLLHRRKRDPSGGFEERLAATFRGALAAAGLLEEEPSLAGRARFHGNEACVRVRDRLLAPNNAATFAALKHALEPLAARLWPRAPVEIVHLADPSENLGARLTSSENSDVATLLARLEQPSRF
jgi:hypothetical protein